MIPRFPPMRGARECATSTVATCADMGMGPGGGGVPLRVPPAWHMQASVRAGSRRCGPTHPAFSPENHPTEDHARSTHPCLRCPDTPHSALRIGRVPVRICGGLVVREPDVPSGCGCPRYCTQETGTSAGWGLVFVGIVGFSGERHVWWSGSHVRSGGPAHMGTGLRPLLTVLFRMIPRFPPVRGARECATPTTPAQATPGFTRVDVRCSQPTTPGACGHRPEN